MINKIIAEYLRAGHKRITVPGFGTFMRKESGEIVFVDLLRNDDGVLSELVQRTGNYSPVEASAVIDRFIFEIRHRIQTDGKSPIEGLGTMTAAPDGRFLFEASRNTTAATSQIDTTQETPRTVRTNPVQASSRTARVPDPRTTTPRTVRIPEPQQVAPTRTTRTPAAQATQTVRRPNSEPIDRPTRIPSGSGNPIETNRPAQRIARPASARQPRPQTGARQSVRSGKPDKLLIIAIIVAILAIAAMIYGIMVNSAPELDLLP